MVTVLSLARMDSPDRRNRILVWSTWGAMSLLALGFVLRYGHGVPAYDEWSIMVPAYTGHERPTARWLWRQDDEYRHPLFKAGMLLLARLDGGRLRAPLVFNAAALALAAGLLLRAARALRGTPSPGDLVFPLLLLHWGQDETLLLNYTTVHAQYTLMLAACLWAACRQPRWPAGSGAALVGAVTLLLPLEGGLGFPDLLPLVAWVLWGAFRPTGGLRGPRRPAGWWAAVMASCGSLVLAGFYLMGYRLPPAIPVYPGLTAILRTAGEYLAAGLGREGAEAWPIAAAVIMTAMVASSIRLTALWRSDPSTRSRTAGLLAIGASLAAHALVVGWGRAGGGPGAGLTTRYMTTAALIPCWIWLAWQVPGRPQAPRLAGAILVLVACTSAVLGLRSGLRLAMARDEVLTAMEHEAQGGATSLELAFRYWPHLAYDEAAVVRGLELLRGAQMGPFRPPLAPPHPTPPHPVIRAMAFSPDGQAFAWGDDAGSVRLRSAVSQGPGKILASRGGRIAALGWSPDGTRLAWSDWSGHLVTTAVGFLTRPVKVSIGTDVATALCWCRSPAGLAVGRASGLVEWRDGATLRVLHTMVLHQGEVRAIAWLPGSGLLLTGGWGDGSFAAWNPATGRLVARAAGHRGIVSGLAATPWGWPVSASWDGTVRVWWSPTPGTLAVRGIFSEHAGPVSALAVAGGSRAGWILSGGWDGAVIARLPDSAAQGRTLVPVGGDPVTALACTPDGRTLAVGTRSGALRVLQGPGDTD